MHSELCCKLKRATNSLHGPPPCCCYAAVPVGKVCVATQDWQVAKRKQDLHLDNIEKGLSTLKGIGEAMGETLKTQDVLIDTIDTKVKFFPTCCIVQN